MSKETLLIIITYTTIAKVETARINTDVRIKLKIILLVRLPVSLGFEDQLNLQIFRKINIYVLSDKFDKQEVLFMYLTEAFELQICFIYMLS